MRSMIVCKQTSSREGTPGRRARWLRVAAPLTALLSVASATTAAHAGNGSLDAANQEVNLTVLFRYPPPQGDIDTVIDTVEQASAMLCDVTEGQLRLGKVTLRAGGCETGNCQVGVDEADVVISPTNNQGAAQASVCGDAQTPCGELGSLGSNVTLSRYYLDKPLTWTHELGHYLLNLPDAARQYQCKPHRPPYGALFECDERTETQTSIMMAAACGEELENYTELTTAATFPDRGQGATCAAEDSVFEPQGVCPVEEACAAVGGYGAMYDGYKNSTATQYPVCQAFDPDTCEYAWSATQWWSLYKFGQILDEMQQAALTLEAVNGGSPVFDTVASGVPQASVPASRAAFCAVLPEIDNQIEAPNQVMLVLDRSWSMAFPDSSFEKCGPGGCPEICGNGKDDDGDPMTDDLDSKECQNPRMKKVQALASDYLDLLAAVPEENIEAGVSSFACGTSYDVSLRVPTTANVASDFIPAIDALAPNGNTGIVDALNAANAQLTGSGKALLLLTDGFNSCGDNDVAGAIESLNDSGTRVYSISFGPAAGSVGAAEIAGGTGGRFMTANASSELGPVFARQFASFVQAGQLIPQLPYAVDRRLTVEAPARGSLDWTGGNDAPFLARTNRFDVNVESGTKRMLILLASDHDDVAGVGVRAVLTGPPGSGPTFFDSAAPGGTPGFTVTKRAAYTLLQVENPNRGAWQLEVSALSGAGVSVKQTGYVTVLTRARGRLTTNIDHPVVYGPGEGVRVGAYLRSGSSFVFNAQMPAALVHPDGSVSALTVEGGTSAEDGYRIHVPPSELDMPGVYEVRLLARAVTGTAMKSDGETLPDEPLTAGFERVASETFVVRRPLCEALPGTSCGHKLD